MEQPPFLLATGNSGKFGEMAAILHDVPYALYSLAEAAEVLGQVFAQIEENGATHEANALLKARYFNGLTGWMTLGEDSGLEVDALQGELGLHTRRWGAGEQASDEEWLAVFLHRMKKVPESERTAQFICVAALVFPGGGEHLFHGVVRGVITHESEAPLLPGLPLSSVFKLEGHDKVYAAMTPHEKAQVSHRGLVVRQVREFLMRS